MNTTPQFIYVPVPEQRVLEVMALLAGGGTAMSPLVGEFVLTDDEQTLLAVLQDGELTTIEVMTALDWSEHRLGGVLGPLNRRARRHGVGPITQSSVIRRNGQRYKLLRLTGHAEKTT